ncbi:MULTISPECIES: nucleotide pyrophosphohydrolase [Fusobacterium]|jgi:NTP pyrophosphatase (non-canonical NTP hydrolase)|uniref:nucleotide pyrophosphohydrolase n=1 Tax=Fusobacterium TaxID=848 RepID=UPI0008A183CB|nr:MULTISPECIES: nucleotide pyrophosphohydrolase [Fusobacterium]OFL93208.1 nucleotide pyrophosphohydrolase [Fusobacterium sp. HMSC073F01]
MEKFDKIKEIVKKFRDDREWSQFHNPKDLAISLSIEAAELLECFQWKSSAEAEKNNYQDIKYEMADVAIYLLLMCDKMGINLLDAIEEKMKLNEKKYPVEKAKGCSKKYNEL